MATAPQEFDDVVIDIPDLDPDAEIADLPHVERGPLTVVNLSGVPIVKISGDTSVFGGSGEALSRAILDAIAELGLGADSGGSR